MKLETKLFWNNVDISEWGDERLPQISDLEFETMLFKQGDEVILNPLAKNGLEWEIKCLVARVELSLSWFEVAGCGAKVNCQQNVYLDIITLEEPK